MGGFKELIRTAGIGATVVSNAIDKVQAAQGPRLCRFRPVTTVSNIPPSPQRIPRNSSLSSVSESRELIQILINLRRVW